MNRGGMVEDAPMGGIMDLETTRQMLFIGGVAKAIGKGVKSVTRGLKKVAKSPLGKAALLGAGIYGLGGGFTGKFALNKIPGKFKRTKNFILGQPFDMAGRGPMFGGFFENMTGLKVAGLSGLAGALLSNVGKDDDDDNFDIEEYYRTGRIKYT